MYTIRKNTWHYHFAKNYADSSVDYETNLCQYVRTVLKGIVLFLFLAVSGMGIIFLNVLGVIDFINGTWRTPDGATLGAIANIATLTIFVVLGAVFVLPRIQEFWYEQSIKRRGKEKIEKSQLGFITMWIKTIRNKVCPSIRIEN